MEKQFLCLVLSTCSLCFITSTVVPKASEDEPGFVMYMTETNLQEFIHHPILFQKQFPTWIKGNYIRNGPGRFEFGHRNVTNLFDGYAKIAMWTFYGNGSASFSTRFLETSFYNESISMNDIAPFLTLNPLTPPFTLQENLKAFQHGMDNPNVNIYNYTDNCVVMNDIWLLYSININSVTLKEKVNADLPGAGLGFPYTSPISSAHPLPELGTSHHLTFVGSLSLVPGMKHKLTLVRVKGNKNREMISQWNVDKMPYMHSFSVTQNYAIFLASPYYFDIARMLLNLNFGDAMDWHKDEPSFIYVVRISTGKVQVFKTETMFSLHHINAFEIDNEHIAMDVVAFEEATIFSDVLLSTLRNRTLRNNITRKSQIKRYVMNFKDYTVDVQTFKDEMKVPCASQIRLPTINEEYRGKNYCYVYGVVVTQDDINYSNMSIGKKDLCGNGKDASWSVDNHYLTEAWFVPRPNGTSEDDGYLLTPVFDGENKRSYLAVIDAQNMTLVNRAYLPTTVPMTFHGRMFNL